MGAWIETLPSYYYDDFPKSHPTWVRGLKHFIYILQVFDTTVAPYMGAWIETVAALNETQGALKSHPTWVRGLKLSILKHQ